MSESKQSAGGWIVALLVLGGFGGVQYTEKNQLRDEVFKLRNQVSSLSSNASTVASDTPQAPEEFTPEQKENLTAERDFNPDEPGTSQTNDEPVDDVTYVASSKSTKFHTIGCSAANRINYSNLVSYGSRAEAVSAGKDPCKICQP